MSSDPPTQLLQPVPPPGAMADPEHQSQPEAAPDAEPPEVMHRTRAVDFLGRRTPIVYQNDNGPCPLLAICNVLLLKNVISLNPDASEVSQQKLLSLVAERLIDSNSNVQGRDEEYVRNREQNVADAIDLLPRLTTGIDVNVMFRKIDDFEFTRERAIFDLLDIPLYHGWIVDPQDTETAAAIASKSYNALASGLAEFKSGKPAEESKHVEEETVDFAAATTAALKIPSPTISPGRSFDEHTLAEPAELRMRRGDREEEEELMRVLNLSKADIVDSVDGSVSFDASQNHSSSNMEKTPHSEIFRSEAHETVSATNKEEHGDHVVIGDGPVLQDTNAVASGSELVTEEPQEALTSKKVVQDTKGVAGGSEVVPEESQETLTSKKGIQDTNGVASGSEVLPEVSQEDLTCKGPEDPDIPLQHSDSTPAFSHESDAPSDQHAAPAINEADKETCRETSDVQIHGQSTVTEDTGCEAAPSHAATAVDSKSATLDDSELLSSSVQGSEPIYQGEEHVLGTGNMVYQNQEPVYEGEVVLAEQADKSNDCLEDRDAEHQWELIDNFLQSTANQLTVYGLFCLQEGLKETELCVFFRNNHFNTMFKYNGNLYLLATDQGFISQTDLVWQKLDEVNGDGVFLTSNFTPFKAETPRNESWNEQQAMSSTAEYIAQFDNSTLAHSSENSDLELAIALQQQEFDRQPQRNQSPPRQQQQQQQQQRPQQPQQPPNQSGRPGLVVGPRRSNAPPPPRGESKKEKCIVM